jgi:hypothetical protein
VRKIASVFYKEHAFLCFVILLEGMPGLLRCIYRQELIPINSMEEAL